MKNIILFGLALLSTVAVAQERMISKTGKIIFEALDPTFAEVRAVNDGVTCVINPKTGEIASLALVKGFRFKIALMEEHFNENYVESDKYPKAVFKGKIDDFDAKLLTYTAKDYNFSGKIELHGKSQDVKSVAKVRKTAAGIEIITDFTVDAKAFDIAIPTLTKNKVTNDVLVKVEFTVK